MANHFSFLISSLAHTRNKPIKKINTLYNCIGVITILEVFRSIISTLYLNEILCPVCMVFMDRL